MLIQLDRTISIHRLSTVDGNKTSYITYTTTMEATIQPLSDSKAGMAGGASGSLFKIYLDAGKNIQENDEVRDDDGNIYKVISGGIHNRNDGFVADYLEVTVQKINQ